jgi:hypothetical protein
MKEKLKNKLKNNIFHLTITNNNHLLMKLY